jgi:REP element-mobilizing transposase RayT
MPQSLAKIYVHLIFSTKNREPLLPRSVQPDLHAYLGGILRDLESPIVEVNSEPDHVHVLFVLARTRALSDVVGQLKSGSSAWLKTKGAAFNGFHWQNGYGAFSVSQSGVDEVIEYIRRQHDHHQRVSFQDEFRAFLRRYEIEFDEGYVWD